MINFKNPLIFVVEDDPAYRKLIENHLKNEKFKNVKTFSSGEECIEQVKTEKPDIVIQDYDLDGGINGLQSMLKVKSISPESEYIFLSGQSSIDVAVETMRKGAFDYVIKDNVARSNIIHKIGRIVYINKLIRDKEIVNKAKFLAFSLLGLTWLLIILKFLKVF
jgi:DNA-binding NtrC family response regulator